MPEKGNAGSEKRISTGLECFLREARRYRGRNIALIANQTSVSSALGYSWDLFAAHGLSLKRIFSPEHGLWSTEQDQVAVCGQPGLPCELISLYGSSFATLAPPENSLDGIDLVLFDIQDVGSRYYTYVNTMALFMRTLQGHDIEFMVLDRPNPLGGELAEGPPLERGYESFVGVIDVPVRHGLTAGELALYYKDVHRLDIKLTVIQMEGWRRRMSYGDTGLPWIGPSPNMPDTETALVYPGLCLLEGTNLSEGRGSTTPFRLFGAPFIDPDEYARELNSLKLGGVYFRPTWFRPSFHKYAGETIGGIFIHISDPGVFRPFLAGVAVVRAACGLYGEKLKFISTPYEFNSVYPAFDLLTGSGRIRSMIGAGESLDKIRDSWLDYEGTFSRDIKQFYLYT